PSPARGRCARRHRVPGKMAAGPRADRATHGAGPTDRARGRPRGYRVVMAFRDALTARGIPYIVGISSETTVWPPRPGAPVFRKVSRAGAPTDAGAPHAASSSPERAGRSATVSRHGLAHGNVASRHAQRRATLQGAGRLSYRKLSSLPPEGSC